MKLSLFEQETIINYNDGEKTASVYTHNKSLCRKLDALLTDKPEECQLVRECHDGQAREYSVPKRWIRVSPPRASNMTPAQRQAAAERMARNLGRV